MKILGSEVSWCIFVMLVQDGSAPMRAVRWRTCPAKFKTGMCEMKILGSEVSCFFYMYFCDVGSGWVGTNAR